MESFAKLKRRTTDLLHNVHQNLPAVPSVPSVATRKESGIKGTWQPVDVPQLPRSSHSLNIIDGSAYIFGGEVNPRQPTDNDLHVIRLPWSSAGADYYKIKPTAAKREEVREAPDVRQGEVAEPKGDAANLGEAEAGKSLDDIPLASPLEEKDEDEDEDEDEDVQPKYKGKGKEPALPEPPVLGDVPSARVGHATAVIGSRIFLFGGRGGPEMTPLEEAGRVWVFDTRSNTWTYLDPAPAVKGGAIIPHPAPRSFHCAVATDRPRDFASPRPKQPETWQQWALGDTSKTGIPQAPIVGNVAEDAVDEESDGYGTFFVHGGCLANGERTNDLWAFNVRNRTWSELPAAPGPARGGAAICISKTRLFRFGGFDGKNEIGGQLDFLHLEVETFDDRGSKGEVAVRAHGSWQTIHQHNPEAAPSEIHAEAAQEWPGPRSVASLEALTIGGGSEYLVLSMGEREPSSDGHEGAGKFYNDVWMFQVPPHGMTAASVTAAVMQVVGRKTGEGRWTRVTTAPYDDEDVDEEPAPRGWLASAPMGDLEEDSIFFWGGLGENNQRLGDGWILRLA